MRQPLPRSLYADTARPAVATPPLEGGRRASVAIVGGGFTGLSSALHLAEHGVDVVLLEAHEPGWGASGRNGGQVNPGLIPNPEQVIADFGRDMGDRMLAFSGDAPNRVFRLVERLGIDCEAQQSGTLRVAAHPRKVSGLHETFDQWRTRGAPVDFLEAADLASLTGTDRYLCGMRFNQGGKVNPLGYARGLAEAAVEAGAAVHGGTPATRLEKAGAAWKITTPTGTVTADKVILGTNGYTDDLWPRLGRTVVPVRGSIAASEPLPAALADRILPAGSVLYEVGYVVIYYRLDRARRLLMGGRGKFGDVSAVGEVAHLPGYAVKLWPFLSDVRWTHAWNGRVAITPDHYPHLHELAPGVSACIGYNGRGVAMATAMGEVLARHALGARAEDLPMPVVPLKPMSLHALWPLAAKARIVYGSLRDRLGV
jgi:glycine/D-amino acid oxidase-like deaminating enzyme